MTAAGALLAAWSQHQTSGTSAAADPRDNFLPPHVPSFLRLEPESNPKYYCFSDFDPVTNVGAMGDNNSCGPQLDDSISLRHKLYQAQMTAPHLAFSLENYPDDKRIGPHIVAGNFQAFLVVDLIMGFLYYGHQLEPFSTV
ncbi:hypothetical protein BGZ94_000409, partial [Podila epigama]